MAEPERPGIGCCTSNREYRNHGFKVSCRRDPAAQSAISKNDTYSLMLHCAMVAPVASVTLLCGNLRAAFFPDKFEAVGVCGTEGEEEAAVESR